MGNVSKGLFAIGAVFSSARSHAVSGELLLTFKLVVILDHDHRGDFIANTIDDLHRATQEVLSNASRIDREHGASDIPRFVSNKKLDGIGYVVDIC